MGSCRQPSRRALTRMSSNRCWPLNRTLKGSAEEPVACAPWSHPVAPRLPARQVHPAVRRRSLRVHPVGEGDGARLARGSGAMNCEISTTLRPGGQRVIRSNPEIGCLASGNYRFACTSEPADCSKDFSICAARARMAGWPGHNRRASRQAAKSASGADRMRQRYSTRRIRG